MPIYLKDDTAADASPESLHRRLRSRLDGMALATKLMLIGGVFLVLALASIGLTLWVFSSKRRPEFAEARLLPFADEPQPDTTPASETRSTRP